MDDIKLNRCNILINSKDIKLHYPVKMVEKVDDSYVILLDIPTRIELGLVELNNIVCYDNQGKFKWRVDNKLPKQITSNEQAPYVAIQIQDNILKATDFFGRRFHISSVDGKLLGYEIVK